MLRVARAKEFIREPKHWLPIVGGLIVFVTFVGKEGYEDKWRSRAEALETAEYIYGVRDAANQTQLRVKELQRQFDDFGSYPGNTKGKPVAVLQYGVLMETIGESEELMDDVSIKLDYADILASKLPKDDASVQEFNALRKTLNQLRIESADVERKLSLHGGSASSFAE